jgi:hypothetical protein
MDAGGSFVGNTASNRFVKVSTKSLTSELQKDTLIACSLVDVGRAFALLPLMDLTSVLAATAGIVLL